MAYQVRDAKPVDAAEAAHVMHRSIKVLCTEDHHNDDRLLSEWLRNKTEANVRRWIRDSSNWSKVAVQDGRVVGFALLDEQGRVLLMYVQPEATGCGIGTQLLAALEDSGRSAGLNSLHLESTATARNFYKKRGFKESRDHSDAGQGLPQFFMEKRL